MKLTFFMVLFAIYTANAGSPNCKPLSPSPINDPVKVADSNYELANQTTSVFNSIWQHYATSLDKSILPFFYTYSYVNKLNDNPLVKDTIIGKNKYVLMTAWKYYSDFHKYSMTDSSDGKHYCKTTNNLLANHPLFLTVGTYMKQWCREHINKNCKDTNLRLMQLLGLPPQSNNDVFVEFWIKPEDLFRPALDSSIDIPSRQKTINATYLKSFSDFSANSFSGSVKYPFTGLGYTLDWSQDNSTHIGLNEFVLKGNKTVLIRRIITTKD